MCPRGTVCHSSRPLDEHQKSRRNGGISLHTGPTWGKVAKYNLKIVSPISVFFTYPNSVNGFGGNYPFLNLALCIVTIKVQKLFKGGNYLRKYSTYSIGHTVINFGYFSMGYRYFKFVFFNISLHFLLVIFAKFPMPFFTGQKVGLQKDLFLASFLPNM